MEIETGFGINPKIMLGTERFTIRADQDGEPVIEEKRKSSKGGVFKQYTLLLKDGEGQDREARFLFSNHFVSLAREHGKDTTKWVGKEVIITPKQQGEFWDLQIEPAGRIPTEEVKL